MLFYKKAFLRQLCLIASVILSLSAYSEKDSMLPGLMKMLSVNDTAFISFVNSKGYNVEKRNTPTNGAEIVVYTNQFGQLIIRDSSSSYYVIHWSSPLPLDFKGARKMLVESGYKKIPGSNSQYFKGEAYKKGKMMIMLSYFPNVGESGRESFYEIEISKQKSL